MASNLNKHFVNHIKKSNIRLTFHSIFTRINKKIQNTSK